MFSRQEGASVLIPKQLLAYHFIAFTSTHPVLVYVLVYLYKLHKTSFNSPNHSPRQTSIEQPSIAQPILESSQLSNLKSKSAPGQKMGEPSILHGQTSFASTTSVEEDWVPGAADAELRRLSWADLRQNIGEFFGVHCMLPAS